MERLFLRVLLCFLVEVRDRLEPTPELLRRARAARQQALLEQQLRALDVYLSVALHSATLDPWTGSVHRSRDDMWFS